MTDMNVFSVKKIIMSLICGGILAAVFVILEFRYWDDSAQLSQSNVVLYSFQLIFLSIMFLVIPRSFMSLKEWKTEGNRLKGLEKCGLILELISLIVIIAMLAGFFSSYHLLAGASINIVCVLLIGIGIMLYYQTKSQVAITFILWSGAILILVYLLSGIGIVSQI